MPVPPEDLETAKRIARAYGATRLILFGSAQEDLALLKVDVEQAEYGNPESSTLVQITGFVKALATGERCDGGENEKLQM
jgi:hypothetical protein